VLWWQLEDREALADTGEHVVVVLVSAVPEHP
jgi:hypothetical protein